MKYIQLNSKVFATIDDELAETLRSDGYAQGYIPKSGNYKQILMHHLVIGKPDEGYVTDHINRNRLDNRKENLRFVTRSENNYNSNKSIFATSKYLGVSLDKKTGLWRASKMHPTTKKVHYIGSFVHELEAANVVEKFIQRCKNELNNS